MNPEERESTYLNPSRIGPTSTHLLEMRVRDLLKFTVLVAVGTPAVAHHSEAGIRSFTLECR
jgi:hypothetical protein